MLPAFTVAMLGAIESLMPAVVSDGMSIDRHNPNVELHIFQHPSPRPVGVDLMGTQSYLYVTLDLGSVSELLMPGRPTTTARERKS